MAVRWVTYAYVSAGGETPICSLESLSGDAQVYLEKHVTTLQAKAGSGTSPPAQFLETRHRQRFDDLLGGQQQQFLDAATDLAADLQALLHGGTKNGLFIALSGTINGSAFAAVLKLEVRQDYAGVLQDVAEGHRSLSAVRNLLDRPGELQKGVVVPDPREQSELIVSDRLPDTALYFLAAIGARQGQKPAQAVVEVAKVLQQVVPQDAEAMVERLTTTDARTPAEFLARETNLPAPVRAEVLQMLTERPRPVAVIDTQRARTLRGKVTADGITITGRYAEIRRRVIWAQRPSGGWRIQIDVDEEPRRNYLG